MTPEQIMLAQLDQHTGGKPIPYHNGDDPPRDTRRRIPAVELRAKFKEFHTSGMSWDEMYKRFPGHKMQFSRLYREMVASGEIKPRGRATT